MTTQLAQINFNGIDYFIDTRLKEFRRVDNPHSRISFDSLKDEGSFYTLKFIAGTDNELAKDNEMYEYGTLVECNVPKKALRRSPEINFSRN